MSEIFESKELAPTERLVMLALADHADDNGKCYPSIRRLCDRTGLGQRAVQTNIKALKEKGYLTVEMNAGQGGANLYIVRSTPAADAPPQEMHPRTTCTTPPHLMRPTPAADAPKPSRTTIEPSEKAIRTPFAAFWTPWPNKVAKAAAEKAWAKLSETDRQDAISRMASWFSWWRAANKDATPIHGATYLNQKRWQDEITHSAQNTSGPSNVARWKAMASN